MAIKKPAAKAAPVEEVAAAEIEVGSTIRFLGYDEDTPDDQRHLEDGGVYEVFALTEPDENGEGGGNPIIQLENPNFNPKKKESETNPKYTEVEALLTEVELVDPEEAGDEEVVEEAPAPKAKPVTKAAPAKAAAKTAPAKPAAKVAPAAKKSAKAAEAAAEAADEAAAEEVDETPDLDNEDPEVLALLDGAENLVALAQELEQEAASKEWQIGGVLYHIKKDKAYEALEGGDEYKEAGGFQKFVKECFNMEYRKAMWLIEIYKHFTIAGIENPAARVAAIGWTKAKTVAKLLTTEGTNTEELLELAASNTVEDLSQAIKEQVEVGGTKGEKVTRITLKFRLLEQDGVSVNAILEAAKEQFALKDIGQALVQIVNDWASEHGGGTATKSAAPKVAAKKVAAAPAAPAAKKAVAVKRATAKA